MRETKLWTWHIFTGLVILVLLGIHMFTMHLDGVLGWFNPAGGEGIDWANLMARAKMVIYAIVYILLLAAALYHGLYGFRTILFELGPGRGIRTSINVLFWIVGICLFVFGTWAALNFYTFAQTG